jgi:hypothetical protein
MNENIIARAQANTLARRKTFCFQDAETVKAVHKRARAMLTRARNAPGYKGEGRTPVDYTFGFRDHYAWLTLLDAEKRTLGRFRAHLHGQVRNRPAQEPIGDLLEVAWDQPLPPERSWHQRLMED